MQSDTKKNKEAQRLHPITVLALLGCFLVFLFILNSPLTSAVKVFPQLVYTKPVIIANATINNSFMTTINNGTGNASTGNCPYGEVVMNITNTTVQCVPLAGGSMDYAYVNTNIANNVTQTKADLYAVIDGNLTQAKAFSMAQYTGNNTAWLSTYNLTYHRTSEDVAANRTAWFSTYNGTYDTFWLSNTTIWNAINNALAGSNSSWNETLANTLYIKLNNASVNTAIADTAYINKSFNETRTSALYYLLTNPSGFITNTVNDLANYFTKTEVNTIVLQNKTDLYNNVTTRWDVFGNTTVNKNITITGNNCQVIGGGSICWNGTALIF